MNYDSRMNFISLLNWNVSISSPLSWIPNPSTGFSKFSSDCCHIYADSTVWNYGNPIWSRIDTSVYWSTARALIVPRANYRMCSIKLHVYADVITRREAPREERNPRMNRHTSSSIQRVCKEELFKRKYAGGERFLSVVQRISAALGFLVSAPHSRCRRRVLDAKLRAPYSSWNI